MDLNAVIKAVPKADIGTHLEGSFNVNRLILIAEQFEIPQTIKHYAQWAAQLRRPDYAKLYDLIRSVNAWIMDGSDLSRLVYDLLTQLHMQQVAYAEINVCPAYYSGLSLDFDGFFEALNDGRRRAELAWGIQTQWMLGMLRDDPRAAEDTVRWASSIPAQRAGVIGVGLVGRDDVQPAAQFEKAFKNAEKRDLLRAVRVGENTGVAGITETHALISPPRIVDARGLWEDDALMAQLAEQGTTVILSPTRLIKQKWVSSTADLPIRRLLDAGVRLVIGSDMASLYQTSLTREYQLAVEAGQLTPEETLGLLLNAVEATALTPQQKGEIRARVREAFMQLGESSISEA